MHPFKLLSLFYNGLFLFSRNASTVPPAPQQQCFELDDPPYPVRTSYSCKPEAREYRCAFGSIYAFAHAYPSQGGLVYGIFTGVELDWLGLSRSNKSQPSEDPHEEDEFAYKILRLGARWWKSKSFYEWRYRQAWKGTFPWPDSYPPILHVAYPSSGGIWVYRQFSKDNTPDEYAKVIMARNMDERGEALKEFGAEFYADIDECPDIPKTLEEGIAVAREWEEKMKELDERIPPHLMDEEDMAL